MSDNSKMPNSWVMTTVGFVFDKISNGANVAQYEEKIGLPISRIETIWNETIDFKRVKYVKENDKEFIEKYALKNNDILFSHINSDSHLGKTAIFKKRTDSTLIHGINLLLLRTNELLNANFINYQFKYLRFRGAFAAVAQKAVNQSSINQAKLKQFTMLLPPLPEQHRIVAKIEELFSSLDKGIESLKTAQQQLQVYRQAALKWAFEGKLTNKVLVEGELPSGWALVKLGDLVVDPKRDLVDGPFGSNLKADEYTDSGVPVFKIQNIKVNRFVDKKINYITEEKAKSLSRHSFVSGDLIITKLGDPLGLCCKVPEKYRYGIIVADLMRLRPNNLVVHDQFLIYAINCNVVQNQFKAITKGTTRPRVNLTIVRDIQIPLPPLPEQHRIVQEIESRLSVCDKIEESIEQSLKQSEALRQSILKKAFDGKLVPQDPNDEPASILLDRIKAEREKSKPENPPRWQARIIKPKKAKS